MVIILTRKDLTKQGKDKNYDDIRLADFSHYAPIEFSRADSVIFVEFDILGGGTFRCSELKNRTSTRNKVGDFNSIELGHYLADLMEAELR